MRGNTDTAYGNEFSAVFDDYVDLEAEFAYLPCPLSL